MGSQTTFRGGVHVPHNKHFTEDIAVTRAEAPKVIYVPMTQHIGAPCKPLVKPGDPVKVGQKIGEAEAFVSAPIHCSVSGKVKEIVRKMGTNGQTSDWVVVENDETDEKSEDYFKPHDFKSMEPKEIVSIIRDAGITGLGGASFPTAVKLSPPPDTPVDTLILNGVECEPYLTSDYRLMVEHPKEIVTGAEIIMKVLGVDKCYIAIEDNKPEAIKILTEEAKRVQGMSVVSLMTKYPQGDEKRIIDAVAHRQVPSGALPAAVGCVVENVGTTFAIYEAVALGKPLYERIVTITGRGIKEPKNMLVRMGTLMDEVLAQCGGFNGTPGKIIAGGPMMGMTVFETHTPLLKANGGLLILTEEEARPRPVRNCLKCGKCVDVCPVHLQPCYIAAYSLRHNFDMTENLCAADCVECGSCSFVCPADRPLVEAIRVAKRQAIANRNKKK